MVAPVAAAASGLGRAFMSAGARIGGPAVTRTMSSQGLRTGSMSFGKVEANTAATAKHTDSTVKWLKETYRTAEKMSGILSKASPAWTQQMQILSNIGKVFLRPIADTMATIVAPILIGLYKLVLKWYQIASAPKELLANILGDGSKSDKIEQLQEQRKTALENGDVQGAAALSNEIAALESNTTKFTEIGQKISDIWSNNIMPAWESVKNWASDIWNNYIVPGWNAALNFGKQIWDEIIVPGWNDALNWAKNIWEQYITPGWEFAKNWAKDIWDTFIVEAWTPLKTWAKDIWNTFITVAWDPVKNWAKDIWDTYISPGWSAVINWAQKIWDDYIVKGFEGLKDWGAKVWEMIKAAAARLNPFRGEKAVGGDITQTGPYMLHAGERVIPAGENARNSNGNTTSITNYISISANINNDMDIRTLASRLAEYNEVEMRRRVSYV